MMEKNKNVEDLKVNMRIENCSNCAECEFLRCFDYAYKNYYCDHEGRTDDMGYVGVDSPPKTSPRWCPKREESKTAR
ncbi:hypothetical protein [Lacrimispora indolis]|uniref:hypothetical protein n=1 Tax=Lacrimispora indolis TaxID=69825 RepID=UPI000462515F|nr:hypothetical protein [[Clostridium] methoxybenzovorans]